MEKMDKTNVIIICIAVALVLLLGIVMLCGACSGKQDPDWDPLTTAGTSGDTTSGESTDNTTGSTTDATGGGTTDATQGPQISVDVVDRDELNNNTQPTKPSTSTNPTTNPTTTPTTTPTTSPTTPTTTPTEPSTEATDPSTEATDPPGEEKRLLNYEEFAALSMAEQIAYRELFPIDGLTYRQWYEAAYQKWYEDTHTVTDGNINLGTESTTP